MMKKLLTALSVALLTALPAATAVAKTDLVALDKELEIMSSILHTALKQDASEGNIRYRSLNAQYLAKQGVVFEVNSSSWSGRNNFNFNFGNNVVVAPPFEPIDMRAIERQVEEAMEEIEETEWAVVVEDALRDSMHVIEATRDTLRHLHSEERELSYEQRELERERRELEFESRNTEGDREKKSLDQRRQQLEKQAKRIKERREEINQRAEKIEKEKKEKEEARVEEYRKNTRAFLANFEGEVADSLCRYGAGLRALPENENVTFVLSKFGDGTPGEKKDRIYVFSYKDIRACVGEKIDASELLTKAETYVF